MSPCRRPGVAMTMSTPSSSMLFWVLPPLPPVMQHTRIGTYRVSDRATDVTCAASSASQTPLT
jgi:hypothetical protein